MLTPCIDVCRMSEERDLCEGCGRTRGEIAAWTRMEENERREVCEQLPERMRIFNIEAK